ncbi:MAG: aminotransferase class IV [Methylacidiphilales bacterium]|nr:aminotransferase class IV [Candidatus Methylacidiphilales bacterium]
MYQDKWCWNNGSFVLRHEATVSILDRGFLFGDGVYEVIPCYSGNPFMFKAHVHRLQSSLREINLTLPVTEQELISICQEIVKKNGATQNQYLYIQVTRGYDIERKHQFPDKINPNLIIWSYPWKKPTESLPLPVSLVSTQDKRWDRCDIKSLNLLANVLDRQYASMHGADEAIFIRNGFVQECSSSNFFLIANRKIVTSKKSPIILSGITREFIFELAQICSLEYLESDGVTYQELLDADEIFISSSLREISYVQTIDGKNFPAPTSTSITTKLLQTFRSLAINRCGYNI